MKIAMIMLAAGNSRRFGENKLLYKVDGTPMYVHALEQLIQVKTHKLESADLKITVVTQYKEIVETAKEKKIQVLFNPHPEQGISSSVKIGLEANLDADAVLFTVSDQPWLSWKTIYELIASLISGEQGIACVSYQGKMGNPCIFRKKYYRELLALTGDRGGKRVILAHPEDTSVYEISDSRELEDVDYKPDSHKKRESS